MLFPRIAICEDLGSSGEQGPVEANRSYLNHQFSLVRLAVYLRFVGHLDQCSFSTRWRKFPVCWGDCEIRVRTGSEECLEWKGVSEKKVDYTVVILQSKLTIQKGEDKKVNAKSFYFTSLARKSHHLALNVQTLDSVIHRINHYPADSVIDFRNTYPLDSAIKCLNNRGLTDKPEGDGALIPPGPP